MKYIKLLIYCLVITLSGCVTFPNNLLPKVDAFPVVSEKPSISLSVNFSQYYNWRPINNSIGQIEDELVRKAVERFNKSGLYSVVTSTGTESDVIASDDIDTDINVEFDVVNDERGGTAFSEFMSALVLYALPDKKIDIFRVSAKIKNNKSGAEKIIKIKDSMTTWRQLFLLPLFPFKMPMVVSNDVQNNMIDTLAIKIHEEAISQEMSIPPVVEINEKDVVVKKDILNRLEVLKKAFELGLISGTNYEQKKADLIKEL